MMNAFYKVENSKGEVLASGLRLSEVENKAFEFAKQLKKVYVYNEENNRFEKAVYCIK